MDYRALAEAMLSHMDTLNQCRPQRKLNDGMRGEAFVLRYVIFHEGRVLPSEISQFMHISTARVAAALNNLERKGLITRSIDPSDRRRILVALTGEGQAFANRQREEMLRHTEQMIRRLGEPDARELVRLVGRVAEIMQELHREP